MAESLEPVKSPYWEVPKAKMVRDMDALVDPERYTSLVQYVETLIKTAVKNPDEVQFYLNVLLERVALIQQVIADAKAEQAAIKTDG